MGIAKDMASRKITNKIAGLAIAVFLCAFWGPSLSSGDDLRDQLKAKGLNPSDVFNTLKKFDQNADEPVAKWEIFKILNPDFKDGNHYLLLFLEGYEKFENGYVRDRAVFVLYLQKGDRFKVVGADSIGEYFNGVDFFNLTGSDKPEMVTYSGSGNHGRFLEVYSLGKDGLKQLLLIDGYGCGPAIDEVDGKNRVLDYYVDIEGVCEACRTCRPLVYRWNGTEFKHDPDDLYEAQRRFMDGPKNGTRFEEAEKTYFGELEGLYLKHPNDPVILFNCAHYANQYDQKDKWSTYSEELKKLVLTDGCKTCQPTPDGLQNRKNLESDTKNLLGLDDP